MTSPIITEAVRALVDRRDLTRIEAAAAMEAIMTGAATRATRRVSALCGSADVVETLGISLELPPDKVTRCIEEVGIGFLYAPLLHTAMKHVMPARREMGVRPVFTCWGRSPTPPPPT